MGMTRLIAFLLLLTGTAGAGLVLLGVGLIYPPAAVVLAGLFLCALAAYGLTREIGARP